MPNSSKPKSCLSIHPAAEGSGQLVRFAARRARCIWIFPEGGTWLVRAGNHGWTHGDRAA